jgi:hypothetical protein
MQHSIESKNEREETDKFPGQEPKAEYLEPSTLESQLLQLISGAFSKFNTLESSSLRQSSDLDGRGAGQEDLAFSIKDRQKYEEKVRDLVKRESEREETIRNLLTTQDSLVKDRKGLEERYKAANSLFEKEKRAREESELNLRSENATIQGLCRKEKERAQKLMKTMAEMQSADPFKLDNSNISSSVKELRYDIKNWARAQRLMPSLPCQGGLASYASRALGREKGPNYEFLKEITPLYHEYTETHQDFKLLLQAYIWKRIVALVFEDDMWAGTRQSLNDDEIEYRLQVGYRSMKSSLKPSP